MKLHKGQFSHSGVAIGHWQNEEARTGCSVVLPEQPCRAAIAWRGAAPATRELDLLHIDGIAEQITGVLLTGGSAFGLAAADGVVRYLEEQRRGYDAAVATVPLVPTLSLFDLGVGDAAVRPTAASGRAACEAATRDEAILRGAVGAGTGATVGKLQGMADALSSGIGLCSGSFGVAEIATIAVSNALGEVGTAGADPVNRSKDFTAESFADFGADESGGNCTFAVVCTNLNLSRKEAQRLADMAFAGISRAIEPAHTPMDFDAVVVLSAGTKKPHLVQAGLLAAQTVEAALLNCVE